MLTAIILCGGKGDRMPYGTGPKCLLSLKNKTILERNISWLNDGVDDFIVCVGNEGDQIRDWLAANGFCPDGVKISDDGPNSHIARRIAVAIQDYDVDKALVLYGDTLAHVDLRILNSVHDNGGRPATITVTQARSEFGIVELGENGRVIGFDEKPLLPYWKNLGYIRLDDAAQNLLYEGPENVSPFEDYLEDLARQRMLGYYQYTGPYLTVNTRKDYILAQQEDWYE